MGILTLLAQKLNLEHGVTSAMKCKCMFCSSHFCFFLHLATLGKEVTKIQKYFVIFVYILQDWQDGFKQIENHATKVNKIPKTKR